MDLKRVRPPDADFPGSSNLQIQFLEEISRPRRWNLSGFHALHLKFSQPFFFLLHWFRAHIPFSLQSEEFSSKQFIILRIVPSSKALKVTDFFFSFIINPSNYHPFLHVLIWVFAYVGINFLGICSFVWILRLPRVEFYWIWGGVCWNWWVGFVLCFMVLFAVSFISESGFFCWSVIC